MGVFQLTFQENSISVSSLTAKFSVLFCSGVDEIGLAGVQCSHQLKGNSFKFGQNTDSRVQMFCLLFTFWQRQDKLSLTATLLVGRVLFVCFEVILSF